MELQNIRGVLKENHNLANLTWFKVGGKADLFFKPADLDDLVTFLKQYSGDINVIGAGSNVIIRDAGIEGVVIKLTQGFNDIVMEDNRLVVGAGCLNYNLSKYCQISGISGFEFLVGIPGCIGGGVVMNAGSYGSEFKDIVEKIHIVDFQGETKVIDAQDVEFKYRGTDLPSNIIITKVEFKITPGDPQEIKAKMADISQKRASTQPITEKTGGSTFANPEGIKAWQLVDKVGMRGFKIGGARISEQHCNFLINESNATASDIENLGELVRARVLEQEGIELKWEIKRIGRGKLSNTNNSIYREYSTIVEVQAKGGQELSTYVDNNGLKLEAFNFDRIPGKTLVAVVGGGMSCEREVSYMTSNGVVNSLLALDYQVLFIDMGADIATVLQVIKPDLVFNALHGTYGEDGCLAGLLNILHIPYTGPGILASALAMNKKKTNEICRSNQLKVIESKIVSKSEKCITDPMPRPYVIKPISQGSSVGVQIIFEEDDFSFAEYDFPYGDEIIVEKYIQGKEIQVAILNGKALGALEIKLLNNKRFYDYEAKYTEGFTEHIYPATLPGNEYQQVLLIAEKLCKIFDCQEGMIRAEFIYEEASKAIYILELNTHPGMTPLSICPEIAAYQNISYTELVAQIITKAKYES